MKNSTIEQLSDDNFVKSHYFIDLSLPSDISALELRIRLIGALSEYTASIGFVRHNIMEGYHGN